MPLIIILDAPGSAGASSTGAVVGSGSAEGAFSYDIKLDGRLCLTPDERYGPMVVGKANSYWCPVGPTPGRAYLLMAREDVYAIKDYTSHTLTWGPATFAALYWVNATRVFPGGAGAGEAAYLVELADKRILAQKFSDTGIIGAGRNFGLSAVFTEGANTYTWQTMLDALWATLPSFGSAPTLPYTPSGAPENITFTGANTWQAIHEILHNHSCTTAYNPIAGTFSYVLLGKQQVYSVPNCDPDYDAEFLGPFTTDCPEKIRLYSHSWQMQGTGTPTDTSTSASGAIAGTLLSVDDWLALDELASGDASKVASKAMQMSGLIKQDLTTPRLHQVFAGLFTSALPGSRIKQLLFRNWGPDFGGTKTEIVGHPGLPLPDRTETTTPRTRLTRLVRGLLVKTDASHAKSASGTCSVYTGTPGSETDSGVNITAYNRFASLSSGKWAWADHNGFGWYLTAGEC